MLNDEQSGLVAWEMLEETRQTHAELRRPSVLLRPDLFEDGDQFCAMYPDRERGCVADSLCGFGDTPEAAMLDFDAHYAGATHETP